MTWKTALSYLNPWRHSRIETYVLKACISMFASALVVVSSLIFLMDYIGVSKLGAEGDLSGIDILLLILQKSPSLILVLLPFAFLFGSIFAFIGLNRRSELIAMRAAGMSAWRFVTPASVLAFAVGILTITVLNPVASQLQENYDRKVKSIQQAAPEAVNRGGIYVRQGGSRKQTVIRAETGSTAEGRLQKVTFWTYDIDDRGVPAFASRVDAQSAVLSPGFWLLRNARESKPGMQPEYYERLSIPSNLDAQAAFRNYASTQSVPFWQLPALIQRNAIAGSPTTVYRLKLHQLLSTPLMFAAMALLGAVFSLRLMRLGGLTALVVSGVSLGFVVFFVNQLFSSLGMADLIPVELAGWSPAVLAMLAGMTLLVYTEDG
jgi:lipopolysaccharide export system permease protein